MKSIQPAATLLQGHLGLHFTILTVHTLSRSATPQEGHVGAGQVPSTLYYTPPIHTLSRSATPQEGHVGAGPPLHCTILTIHTLSRSATPQEGHVGAGPLYTVLYSPSTHSARSRHSSGRTCRGRSPLHCTILTIHTLSRSATPQEGHVGAGPLYTVLYSPSTHSAGPPLLRKDMSGQVPSTLYYTHHPRTQPARHSSGRTCRGRSPLHCTILTVHTLSRPAHSSGRTCRGRTPSALHCWTCAQYSLLLLHNAHHPESREIHRVRDIRELVTLATERETICQIQLRIYT